MNFPNRCMVVCCLVSLCGGIESRAQSQPASDATFRIAFGSCAHHNHPLPILDQVVEQRPDLFIFLGDNIYGDTEDMDLLRQRYAKLGNKPSYRNLKEHTKILATWDDHDYGCNDSGREYPRKEASKQVFLEFFEEPESSERFRHEGIYHCVYRQVGGRTVQILLLDCRTFRDGLLCRTGKQNSRRHFYPLRYLPHTDSSKTLLGEAQWAWLEQELRKPADFRVLATGTQFGIEYNGFEAWANFPHEQERLVQLIRSTRAEHLVIVSGDVHYAEISKFSHPDCYPLYDITSSGLSQTWSYATPNSNRIEGPVMDNNFGLLTVDFEAEAGPRIVAEVWDIRRNQRVEYQIALQEISFAGQTGE